MSKRALIIKWAVIAALVVVLVFFASLYNSVFNTKPNDTNNSNFSNVNAVATPNTSTENVSLNNSDADKKTLTVFPKTAPVVNTPLFNYLQNIGGSKNDEIVASLNIGNYYYVICESDSVDHDFDSSTPKCLTVSSINSKGTLEKVFVIEGTAPVLLDYTIAKDGIIVVYKDSCVKLIKLTPGLTRIKEAELSGLTDADACNIRILEDSVYLFASSNSVLNAYLLNNDLQVIKSKQSVYSGHITVNAIFTMSNAFRVFLSVESGRSFIKLLELDNELDTMVLKDLSDEFSGNIISVTPFFNNTQFYAMLIASNGGTYLKIYDDEMLCTNMNYICKEKNVVLINFNNSLMILGNKTAVCCCLHGDVILQNVPELNCFLSVTDWLPVDNKICILGTNENNESIVVSYSSNHSVIASVNLGVSTPCGVNQSLASIVILLNASATENTYNSNYGALDGYIVELKNEILQ